MSEGFKEFLRSRGIDTENPIADISRVPELWREYQYQQQKTYPSKNPNQM